MKKHKLNTESLKIEAFETIAPVDDVGGCVCDYPPCICTAGEDCTTTG